MTGDLENYLVYHIAAPDPGVMLPLHHALPACPDLSHPGPALPVLWWTIFPSRGEEPWLGRGI